MRSPKMPTMTPKAAAAWKGTFALPALERATTGKALNPSSAVTNGCAASPRITPGESAGEDLRASSREDTVTTLSALAEASAAASRRRRRRPPTARIDTCRSAIAGPRRRCASGPRCRTRRETTAARVGLGKQADAAAARELVADGPLGLQSIAVPARGRAGDAVDARGVAIAAEV